MGFRRLRNIVIAVIATCSIQVAFAGGLQVLPTRVVLEKERFAELLLINNGNESSTYRIYLKNIRTDVNGTFSDAIEARDGELFADKMIRYSPRSVDIAAKQTQTVRVMLRKPKGLEEGEYRTHMVFRNVPKDVSTEGSSENITMSVKPIMEVSIPVIVRVGRLEATVVIDSASINTDEKGSSNVTFNVTRDGKRSLYGDAEVLINEGDHKGTRVGYSRGIAVYYPNKTRKITLPVNNAEGIKLDNTSLLIKYTENPEFGGRSESSFIYRPQ